MANIVAGAFTLLASAQLGAQVEPIEAKNNHYIEQSFMAGSEAKVVRAVVKGIAAIGVSRLSDEPFEYYPLQARFNDDGRGVGDALSVHRGGVRYSLAAVRPAKQANALAGPDFRKDAKKMAAAMPGYPQPARIVIGVKINY